MNKEDLLQRIYQLGNLSEKPSLDYMRQLAQRLGSPHMEYETVHVTGSVGKGSTTAMISSMLTAAKHRTGMFTSPHLVDFNERIQVDGKQIADEDLLRIAALVDEAASKLERQPRFHEFVAAIAFVYFAEQRVDIAVIEVAMGGRYDSTNIIDPLVAVITNISLEHAQVIGPTLSDIAREKTGIIKEGCTVVTAEQDGEILAIIRQQAAELDAPVHAIHDECQVTYFEGTVIGQQFTVQGMVTGSFELQLLGNHQIVNALAALLACNELNKAGIKISADAAQKGLAQAHLPGRLQAISLHPLVLLDGAHNEAGMLALCEYMQSVQRDVVVLVGLSEGRDAALISDYLAEFASRVIVTESSFKAQPAEHLAEAFAKYTDATIIRNPAEAYEHALAQLGEREALLVTGSLYLIGDILAHVQKKE